jgi:hypothetical protein
MSIQARDWDPLAKSKSSVVAPGNLIPNRMLNAEHAKALLEAAKIESVLTEYPGGLVCCWARWTTMRRDQMLYSTSIPRPLHLLMRTIAHLALVSAHIRHAECLALEWYPLQDEEAQSYQRGRRPAHGGSEL